MESEAPPLPLDSDNPIPFFNNDMITIFGDPLNPGDGADNGNIRTTEAMNKAIYALFFYRVENQLEFAVAFD